MAVISKCIQGCLIVIIYSYRLLLSSCLPPTCRFTPSCSQYAIAALNSHGCIKGGCLMVKRLVRCHPWHPGGFDPVP